MPKGPIFYQPPDKAAEDEAREEEAIAANPNLNFADILSGMGGAGLISSENEESAGDYEEEETKDARPKRVAAGHKGVRVFRPNLTAPQQTRFAEDRNEEPAAHPLLKKEFEEHLANPATRPIQTESDSDTAPCPAVVDEKEETDEERKERKMKSIEDSAKQASSEDEAMPSHGRLQSAKVRNQAKKN